MSRILITETELQSLQLSGKIVDPENSIAEFLEPFLPKDGMDVWVWIPQQKLVVEFLHRIVYIVNAALYLKGDCAYAERAILLAWNQLSRTECICGQAETLVVLASEIGRADLAERIYRGTWCRRSPQWHDGTPTLLNRAPEYLDTEQVEKKILEHAAWVVGIVAWQKEQAAKSQKL